MTFYPKSLEKEILSNFNVLIFIKNKFTDFQMKFFEEDCYFQLEINTNNINNLIIIYESFIEKKTNILNYNISILGNNHYLLIIL